MLFHLDVVYSKIGGGGGDLQQGLTAPPSNPPAAKFASQGEAHKRNDAQIKFLYCPLIILKILTFTSCFSEHIFLVVRHYNFH